MLKCCDSGMWGRKCLAVVLSAIWGPTKQNTRFAFYPRPHWTWNKDIREQTVVLIQTKLASSADSSFLLSIPLWHFSWSTTHPPQQHFMETGRLQGEGADEAGMLHCVFGKLSLDQPCLTPGTFLDAATGLLRYYFLLRKVDPKASPFLLTGYGFCIVTWPLS